MQTRAEGYYFFVFVIKNTKDSQSRVSFIFLRRTTQEMSNIFHNHRWTPLIGDLDSVLVLKSATELQSLYFEQIKEEH